MSYRGRPSKGCESCRARKVKCDEGKPSCARCSRANYECKYRDQADLLFRNQTAFAAQKAEDSWRKRAKSHQRSPSAGSGGYQSSAQSESSPEASSSILTLNNMSLGQRQIQPDLQRLAYERFIYDFVVFDDPDRNPNEPSSSIWDFVPSLYQTSAEGSALATIVHAVSYANFSSRCNAPHVQALAEECLAKGFRLLQKTLADKSQASSDHALCAVYLLGVWENLCTAAHDGNFLAHKDGANALLQLRTVEEFFSNPISARLYEVSFAQMVIGNLQHAKPPNLPVRNLPVVKKLLPALHSASGIYVIQLIHEEAILHARWHDTKKGDPPSTRQDLQELLQHALDLDAEFQTWESTIPVAWRYQVERNTPATRTTYAPRWRDLLLSSRGAPEEIHSHTTLKRCWIWMFFRTSRMFLLRDLIEMLNWMFRLPETTGSNPASTPASMPSLDNLALSIHHAFATSHLVTTLANASAAIPSIFTVPIPGKPHGDDSNDDNDDDVVGMRGYTAFWSLGVMDSILHSGLVPDSPLPPQDQPPSVFKLPSTTIHPLYHNPLTAIPPQHAFPPLPPLPSPAPLPNLPTYTYTYHPNPTPRPPLPKHPFDTTNPHPNDATPPNFDFNIPLSTAYPAALDVAARREWIREVLSYMGARLGVRKALGVVAAAGEGG